MRLYPLGLPLLMIFRLVTHGQVRADSGSRKAAYLQLSVLTVFVFACLLHRPFDGSGILRALKCTAVLSQNCSN